MVVIPVINKDTSELKMLLYEKIQQEHVQRRIVMLIVCVALLWVIILPQKKTENFIQCSNIDETNLLKFDVMTLFWFNFHEN